MAPHSSAAAAPRPATKKSIANNDKQRCSKFTEIARQKGSLPTISQLRNSIPPHCFKRSTLRSLGLVLRDGLVIVAVGYAGWHLPTSNLGLVDLLMWNTYWFLMGTALTGWWVLAHECGHRSFSPSNYWNDSVGFVLHSVLLVPYFSWQFSHKKHHAKTNHLLDGETHVPPSNKWAKQHAGFHSFLGDDAFAVYGLVTHLLFGWPMYLILNVTGARRVQGTNEPIRSLHDHFRPSSKLFPSHGDWNLRVLASTAGVMLALCGIFYAGSEFGHAKVSMLYWPSYLWVNFWLVLYTWLQHTHPDLPHYGEDEWTWVRGALSTVDRPYGPFDWMHHSIGSTHVCHHIFPKVPCYHAVDATAALRAYLDPKGLYHYDGRHFLAAAWNVAQTCHFTEARAGVQFYKSLSSKSKAM